METKQMLQLPLKKLNALPMTDGVLPQLGMKKR